MKVVSIDIETTGVSKEAPESILQIGIVLFDTNSPVAPTLETCPTLTIHVIHENLTGSIYALALNSGIIKDLNVYHQIIKKQDPTDEEMEYLSMFVHPENVAQVIRNFLDDHGYTGSVNFAGKNVGVFDIPFMENTIPEFGDIIRYKRRFIDPAILYFHQDDDAIPDLQTCKQRFMELYPGVIYSDHVSHDALDDAMDIANLVYYPLRPSSIIQTVPMPIQESELITLDLITDHDDESPFFAGSFANELVSTHPMDDNGKHSIQYVKDEIHVNLGDKTAYIPGLAGLGADLPDTTPMDGKQGETE